MQNTNQTQKGIISFFVLVALSFMALAFIPESAEAKSYTMPEVDISAEAAADGSLNVVEHRSFDFDGDFTAVWWTFSGLPENASLKINGVTLTKINSNGTAGQSIELSETSFILSWRDAGGPGGNAYSLDSPKNTVYVFFNASNEKIRVDLDYTVVNGVQAYKDVAEVYWKYIPDHWQEASDNVSMTVTLPVPEDVGVVAGENVMAWGHGPIDGSAVINNDGSVTYKVSRVKAGQYAEARILFPVDWLTELSPAAAKAHADELRLETVLKEEQTWSDQSNRERTLSLLFVIVCGLIAVLLILWAIRSYFKYGKEYTPDFQGEYWRDVPSPGDHPAVIGRLWRWDRENANDFTATLMYLSHIGAIQIHKGSYEKPGVLGTKIIDDYYLTRVPAVADTLTNPIDISAMNLLFKKIGRGADSVWFGAIEKYGEDNAESFVNAMTSWQGKVSAETNKREFFELKGNQMQMRIIAVAVVFAIAAIAVSFLMENFIPLIFVIPAAIALFFIASNMPRRSREGNNIDAKSKALRNWLTDFSTLDERPPTDVKVWGEFMVYAYIFGVAREAIKGLQMKVPEFFAEDSSVMGTSYVPWWFWYSSSHGLHGTSMPSASDMLQTSVANTIQTAQSAMSAASGNSSSGGGFGGGFSGGGGGGFGGGGGAR